MRLPDGRLQRQRVVEAPATALAGALDASLTGYALLAPQDALLLDADGRGVLTFTDGVPMAAYHTGTEAGGPTALADLAGTSPYRLSLYATPTDDLARVHERDSLRVRPTTPADRLAGDQTLVDRTRRAAEGSPAVSLDPDAESEDPLTAFLENEAKIEAIQAQAREEAQARADEWF